MIDAQDQRDQERAKYRELAEHAREMLFQQQARFSRVDEMASRQLSASTIVLGAATFFGKWAIDELIPPTGWLAWATLIVGGICAALVTYGVWHLIGVIKHHKIPFAPMDSGYLDFVRRNNRTDVNYHLARVSTKALDELTEKTHEKTRLLAKAYRLNRVSFLLLAPLVLFYAAHRWQVSTNEITTHLTENSVIMGNTDQASTSDGENDGTDAPADKPTGQDPPASQLRPDTGVPDITIEGPDVIYLTESYDPGTLTEKVDTERVSEQQTDDSKKDDGD